MISDFSGNFPRNTVFGPRRFVKQIQHEILARQEHSNLVAEELLKGSAAPHKARPAVATHFLPGDMVRRMPKMMPGTKSDRMLVYLRTLASSPATLSHMLNRGMYIKVAHQ